jgi:TRAP transporter TAXI family solute receptor
MRYLLSVAVAAGSLCLAAFPAAAQKKVELRFGTVGIGGSWYNYGAGMAELVKAKLPAGSTIDVLPRAGGIGNLKLMQNGEIEVGISFSTSSAEACGGFGAFKSKMNNIRAVLGGLDAYFLAAFVTKKSGVTSWDDIIAAKNHFHLLTTKPGGSGEAAVREVIKLMGSSKADIAKKGGLVEPVSRASAAETIRDGQADGWAHIVTRGHPGATQIATINDVIVLPLPDKALQGMVKEGWTETDMPAGLFRGQTGPVHTVKTASNLIAAASVPEDVVYTFTKAIMENAAKLPKIHAALADFDPKQAASPSLNGNCPMHPGAVKYFKEAGLMK